MKIKPKYIIGGSILLLLIVIPIYFVSNKNDYSIENKTWDVCLKTDFHNPEGNCSYFVSYFFHGNGSFTEFVKSDSLRTEKNQSEKKLSWNLENNVLTFNVKTKTNQRTTQHDIVWIDNSKFYTVEKNSLGITTETFYTARD